MKNNKGVTLSSLTVYIIVLVIILVVFSFISANYTSQISEVTAKGKISNEAVKLYSYILSDIKASNKVTEFSDDYVRFDNDVKYYIRYLNTLSNNEREKRQYEIYRNDVLISENILDANFDYDDINNTFTVRVRYLYGKTFVEKNHTFQVGRGV